MTREQILAELEKTRNAISRNASYLGHDLDFGTKIRASITRNAFAWLLGAAFLGFLLSGRKKAKPIKASGKRNTSRPVPEPVKKAGKLSLLLAAGRFAIPFVKPLLRAYALKGLSQFASKRTR